ncbi:MAG: DCC1-like thiol-disulfide oxidoreductase family protein [Pacificimonas sp.]
MTDESLQPLPAFDNSRALFVFDGHCGFCSAAVRFVLRHDKAHRINLTPAQGPLGSALYAHFGLSTDDYDTNLLIENGRLLTKSDASLRLFELLGWPWRAARLFRLVPPALRDVAYGVVARNRMRIWGRRDQCLMPTPDERDRFIGL